ncbi:FtsX-like permease family protein [Terriglobus albidus]|uniref:FtsX-like permease family protein n=1 Tax=Terriglobus albidus TaxID=1592106 RepID=UPI0021DF5582|nr:FtsX-like permease family protein [Terriglobus albidus]
MKLGKPATDQELGSLNLVNSGYFPTLRIPLLQGRLWNETENRNGAHVALINQTLARSYFPNGDAVGHSLKLLGIESRPPEVLSVPGIADAWLLIVGVVGDARNDGLKNPVKPGIFIPYTLSMSEGTQVLARSDVPPLTLMHALATQVNAVNPEQQIYNNVEDLETWISNEPKWQQDHLVSWIFGLFAALGMILAAVGLYSVVSYTVAQRTNEFGIRLALGAGRGHVLRIVFASTFLSVGSGVLCGLALTVVLSKFVAQWSDGNAQDPFVLLGGVLVLGVVAGIACAVPAREASRVDPITALRCD